MCTHPLSLWEDGLESICTVPALRAQVWTHLPTAQRRDTAQGFQHTLLLDEAVMGNPN